MPPIPMDKMTEAQKKAVAEYKAIRNTDLVGPPWTVLLRVPDLVVPSLQLRMHNQQNSALTQKLTEFAILIAARHWTNSYEWNAHYTLGEKAGLSTDIMAAVADGRRPERMADDEATPLRLLHGAPAPRKRQRRDLRASPGEVRRARCRRGRRASGLLHVISPWS